MDNNEDLEIPPEVWSYDLWKYGFGAGSRCSKPGRPYYEEGQEAQPQTQGASRPRI